MKLKKFVKQLINIMSEYGGDVEVFLPQFAEGAGKDGENLEWLADITTVEIVNDCHVEIM